jgi:hypothetical protein
MSEAGGKRQDVVGKKTLYRKCMRLRRMTSAVARARVLEVVVVDGCRDAKIQRYVFIYRILSLPKYVSQFLVL